MHGIVLLGVILRSVLVFLKNNIKNIFEFIRHGLDKFRPAEKKMIWMGSLKGLQDSRGVLNYRVSDQRHNIRRTTGWFGFGIPVLSNAEDRRIYSRPAAMI
jgi:hypothetical protein